MAIKKIPAEVLEWFREQGRRGGEIGGKVAAANMTPEERAARAKKASIAGVAARRLKAAAKLAGSVSKSK